MEKEKYIEDLREIKETMNRATRFISLSGLSGVSTGIIAIAGALLLYQVIFKDSNYLAYNAVDISSKNLLYFLLIAGATLVLSIASAILITTRKTKKQNQKAWNTQSKQLLTNLSIPLITGGLLCLMLLLKGFIGLLFPLTLIFYGLSLINGSKYTMPEIRYLGLIEILLGLIAFQFISLGILFWVLGFGIIQIIYGLIVQTKY